MTLLHIPDDELHAYLDQALPRSRCVVIESHLAGCVRCRAQRDSIAALRDRTTHLLATLRPVRHRIPPSFEELSRRMPAASPARPAAPWRSVAWAASVLAALGLGYSAHDAGRDEGRVAAPAELAVRLPTVVDDRGRLVERHEEGLPAPVPASASRRVTVTPVSARHESFPAPAAAPYDEARLPASLEVSTDTLTADAPTGEGLWRTVPWTAAREQVGTEPPRVDGVPVVQVQVQPAKAGPLTVVAQQLTSGEMITTIEGPVDDVWALLSRRGDQGDTAGAQMVQQGTRLLAVTGQLPADSLRAMVRRVNAASRVR